MVKKRREPTRKTRTFFFTICSTFRILILVLVLLLTISCARPSSSINIVVIIIDTLRSDHLPFYGYPVNTAPFLNDISKKSYIFQNTFAASSWTSASTASIFTSLYPFQHGVLVGFRAVLELRKTNPEVEINRIPGEIDTLAEILKENGYRTFGISDNLNICKRQGFAQGFDKFETHPYKGAPFINSVLKNWKNTIKNNGKYFLYIHYMDPHKPYHKRQPYYQQYKKKQGGNEAGYDSEIRFFDDHFADIYKLFEWNSNTLLVVTSDHGEAFSEHGLDGHAKSLYREEIQVPLIIQLPGAKSGGKINRNVSTIDIMPTILDLIGCEKKDICQGISLVSFFDGKDSGSRTLYSNLLCQVGPREIRGFEWKAAIWKEWHYLFISPGRKKKLFDVRKDPAEKINRYWTEKPTADEFHSQMTEFVKYCKKYKQQKINLILKKQKIKALKTLGYIN